MRIAKLMGVMVAACLALAGLSSAASAAELVGATGAISGETSETARLTNTSSGNELECKKTLVSGEVLSATDIDVVLLFHECTATVAGIKVNCSTSGQSTGLILAEVLALPVDLPDGMPGLKFEAKPGQTILSTFTCGGLVKVEVKGTVEGLVTEPGYNTPSHSLTLVLETTGEGTSSKQVLESTLESSENGGTFHPATEKIGATTVSFVEEGAEAEFVE